MRRAIDDASAARARADTRAPRHPAPVTHLSRLLRFEPWWLRGVTWRLMTMIVLFACLQNAPEIIRAQYFHRPDDATPWAFVWLDLVTQLFIAIGVLVIAAVLLNLRRPQLPRPLALGIAVVVATFATLNVMAYVFFDGTAHLVEANMQARRIALPWAIAAAAWYFLDRGAARAQALRDAEVAQRRTQSAMLEARLQALHAQVEPHFLFNTLAHVRRLYSTDPVRARLMLDGFRAYLRSALPRIRGDVATLGSEVELARAYLDIQQVRMGRRLRVRVDADTSLLDRAFPPMMMLSLVENAIKHGLNPRPDGGEIALAAAVRGDMLEVTVSDTGNGIGDQIGTGVGLANIRDRLTALHGDAARLTLASNVPHGVRATIAVPLVAPGRDGMEAAARAPELEGAR